MRIGEVVEDVYSRCLGNPDVVAETIREMVLRRWTSHDLSMHVACRLPIGTSFETPEERREAVIEDLVRSCSESESMLRVVVATDVAMWTDEEIQSYRAPVDEPAPLPDMM
jgi:hypothetical protein